MNVDNDQDTDRATALVIDDDATVRLLLGDCLGGIGFDVHVAEEGRQGIETYSARRPDIIILDVMMPGMDGFEVCETIRADPEGVHVPILMMTGLDDVDSVNRAYEVGATDFITKPVHYPLLQHRVRYLLRAAHNLLELNRSQRRLSRSQCIARLGHWEWAPGRGHLHVSHEIEQIFGLETAGKRPAQLAEEVLGRVPEERRNELVGAFETVIEHRRPLNITHRFELPDGTTRIVEQQAEFAPDEFHGEGSIMATAQDVTEREQAAERISYLAYHDSLTGLPNRESFKGNVRQALDLARRPGRIAGLLFLDLDNFKHINDTLSHRVGDLLLEGVAERIVRTLRTCDRVSRWAADDQSSTVARLGGDEFTILLSEINQPQDAATIAERLLRELAKPFVVASNEIFVTASIGIAVYPHDGNDFDSLLMSADTAMYHAKDGGKNTYRFYTQSLNASARKRMSLENSLRQAVARGEMFLCFQPQIDLRHGRIAALEALARWRNGDKGLVSPSDFVPIAESCGLILDLGKWVMTRACTSAKRWHDAGHTMPVAVNISGVQFRQPDVVDMVAAVLKETGADPSLLELEFTETVIMEGGRDNVDKLTRLKDMGVRLAIDDFGTGYSSLSYLKDFPVDALKIDRSFIKDLGGSGPDAAIAQGIIALAHGLGIEVVAEGVESQAQLRHLRLMECDKVQGFLLGHPLHEDDIPKLIFEQQKAQLPAP